MGLRIIPSLALLMVALSFPVHAEYNSLINLQSTTTDIEILGATGTARAGYALCVGDFDGNGLSDLAVSADGEQPLAGTRKGAYYIIWGEALAAAGTIDLATSPDVTRVFGRSDDFPLVCSLSAGDFNGDGRDDLVIGTPLYSLGAGRAYVLLGQLSWPDTVDLQSSPPGLIRLHGAPGYEWLGFAACASDFNGDDIDDLVVSAPATPFGEVYVIVGGSSLASTYQVGSDLPGTIRIIDNNLNQYAGSSLASADFDRDGNDDLVIGGPGGASGTYDGIVTILYGESAPSDTVLLSNPAHRVKRIHGQYNHARLGEKVATFDLNADSRPDLVASAPYSDPQGCRDCGEIYLIYDVEGLPESTTTAEVSVSMTRLFGGPVWDTHYGIGLACGDFTGDGLGEAAIAGTGRNNPTPANRDTVVVAYGNLEPVDSTSVSSDASLSRIVSDDWEDHLGQGMTAADLNGDGVSDLILGAHYWANASKVYVLFGSSAGTGVRTSTPALVWLGNARPNPFGETTRIDYSLARESRVSVDVFDVRGRLVRVLKEPSLTPTGTGAVHWNGRNDRGRRVPAGVYFVKIRAGAEVLTRKVVLVR